MARIKVCGECMKPLRECECPDDGEIAVDIEGLDGGDDCAA
jgi:hypothetical protein